MSAIEKINQEMQKNPDDAYTEIVGQYVIDRCMDPLCSKLAEKGGKTLKGAMDAVLEAAKKKKKGNCAVLVPSQVFGAVDAYFGFSPDLAAQRKAIEGAFAGNESEDAPAAVKTLRLEDFF